MRKPKSIHGIFAVLCAIIITGAVSAQQKERTHLIVDTGQMKCYDNDKEIPFSKRSQPFYGQDAQYEGNRPAFRDNGDGKVSNREFDGPSHHFDRLDKNN
ncbi:MAG: hypothetical protein JRI75_12965, partial [Deltaproteobacteria bacterium]|nr:hypothetical protein [Deltaproteobacteria bacterium]